MKWSVCCGPQSLARDGEDLKSSIQRLSDALQEAGAGYLEWSVGVTQPEGDWAEYEKLREALQNVALKPEAWNCFVPGHHRITGPDVDLNRVLEYCTVAMNRCRELGGEVIVLGSGGARKVQDGFSHEEARKQFMQFGRELGPLAQEAGITIAIEPLNVKEDNFLNSVKDGAAIVDEIAHPNIQLLADLYHMAEDAEPIRNVSEAGSRLRHTHVADRGRVAPGFAENGEEDFIGFFRALREANYDARCSFEGSFSDMSTQLKPALALLQQRWEESN